MEKCLLLYNCSLAKVDFMCVFYSQEWHRNEDLRLFVSLNLSFYFIFFFVWHRKPKCFNNIVYFNAIWQCNVAKHNIFVLVRIFLLLNVLTIIT